MPAFLPQKAGLGDNKGWTVASKSGNKNTINRMKTASVYNGKCSCCLREEYYVTLPDKSITCLKRNMSLFT